MAGTDDFVVHDLVNQAALMGTDGREGLVDPRIWLGHHDGWIRQYDTPTKGNLIHGRQCLSGLISLGCGVRAGCGDRLPSGTARR